MVELSSNADRCRDLTRELEQVAGRIAAPVQIMEVCGTHTVSVFRYGLRTMLPHNLRLISGPGCPVCVTPQGYIDAALELAGRPDVIIATYGDMLRVPGAAGSLEMSRAAGADVRVVNSARSALRLAGENLHKSIVFLAVGFETTAPATAVTLVDAKRRSMGNFTVLSAHKRIVPAMLALLQRGDVRLDGFLCPGHVSVIIGADAYRPVISRHGVPCVIAGFEPADILAAMLSLVEQIACGEARLENAYAAAVGPEGNRVAQELLDEVFETAASPWRALGEIADSGFEIRNTYADFDAARHFGVTIGPSHDHPQCRCGDVICGVAGPTDCALFGTACTPLNPYGPCMVSSEGTCSAWFKYGGRESNGRSRNRVDRSGRQVQQAVNGRGAGS